MTLAASQPLFFFFFFKGLRAFSDALTLDISHRNTEPVQVKYMACCMLNILVTLYGNLVKYFHVRLYIKTGANGMQAKPNNR